MIDPFENLSEEEAEAQRTFLSEEDHPQRGLIRAKLERKTRVHTCHPPGEFLRFLHWICFHPIRQFSLWRCECGKVWKWDRIQNPTNFFIDMIWTWVPEKIDRWLDKGGRK